MPGGDGTGPRGQGPRTGGGFGYCSGYNMPGSVNPIRGGGGRGAYGGRGGGHGHRNMFYATGMYGWQRAAAGMPSYGMTPYVPQTATDNLEIIKQQALQMESALRELKARIEELENSSEK